VDNDWRASLFVLGGYLITRNLLQAREEHAASADRPAILKSFYIRRVLRTFPAYYVALFLAALFNVEG